MFSLAVGITVVRLRALPALGQVVAVLAAVEAFEDRDPQGLRAGLLLGVLDDVVLFAGAVTWWRRAGGGLVCVVVARGAVVC